MKVILRIITDNDGGETSLDDINIDRILPMGTVIPEVWYDGNKYSDFIIGKYVYDYETDEMLCLAYDGSIEF